MEVPCPSYGFYTVGKSFFGTYSQCPICAWQDDGVQLANPACGGGANPTSLIKSQQSALSDIPATVIEHKGYKRDPNWRPFSEDEIRSYEEEMNHYTWKNDATRNYSAAYWATPKR